MASEQANRRTVGWSREQLAQASGVSLASVYLFERIGTAGSEDDTRIRNALLQAEADYERRNVRPAANDQRRPQSCQRVGEPDLGHS